MATNNESTEARLARLETVCALQQRLIDALGTAARGHQGAIETLARHAGLEIDQQQPAQGAPLTERLN